MTKKVFLILLALVLAVSLGVVGCTTPAEEEEEEEPEVITLKYGTIEAETHFIVQDYIIPWQNKITEETDGLVQWENYFGTLVSITNTYGETQAGLVDVGRIWPQYESTGFDIQRSWSNFFVGARSLECQIAVFEDLVEMFPEIKAEFADVKLLDNGFTSLQQNLMTTQTPIYHLADLEGLQIRCYESYLPTLAELGAAGVVMSMFDVYNSLETGIIDGLIGQSDTLKALNFADLINYHTTLDLPYGVHYCHGMNWDTWNSLPPDIQQVFEDNMDVLTNSAVPLWQTQHNQGIEWGEQEGVEFIELPPEELEEFYSLLRESAITNAEILDGLGLPGTEIYEETQRLIAEYQA